MTIFEKKMTENLPLIKNRVNAISTRLPQSILGNKIISFPIHAHLFLVDLILICSLTPLIANCLLIINIGF